MGLDIRLPIGLMFTVVGVLLVIYGLATSGNAELYHRSQDININLWWGLVLLMFGVLMLAFGAKSRAGNVTSGEPDVTKAR